MGRMHSFEEVHKTLAQYVPRDTPAKTAYSLDRMIELMEALGNPQDEFAAIHVAGTSGKTSTSYYIASLLKASGKRTGLTVSPYINEINERVQVDLEPLPEQEFCGQLEAFLQLIENGGVKPTYFELLVAFAYWYFAKTGVEYAVIEVGVGGLLDGTNVMHREDKVCVITDIGIDHTRLLGKTLPEIAAQKAGIIKRGNDVFMLEQPPEIMDVISRTAERQQANLHVGSPSIELPILSELPSFQRRNWLLASRAYEFVRQRDGLPPLDGDHLAAAVRTPIPGRMETRTFHDKTLILDSAHNEQKIRGLAAAIHERYGNERIDVLFGVTNKPPEEIKAITRAVTLLGDNLIITGFNAQQDHPKTSAAPSFIAATLKEQGFHNFAVVENNSEALKTLLASPSKVLLITGSIYLLAALGKQLTALGQ